MGTYPEEDDGGSIRSGAWKRCREGVAPDDVASAVPRQGCVQATLAVAAAATIPGATGAGPAPAGFVASAAPGGGLAPAHAASTATTISGRGSTPAAEVALGHGPAYHAPAAAASSVPGGDRFTAIVAA